jgi:hypothetical protein
MKYLQWLLILIPAFVIEVLAWVATPIAALFVTNRDFTRRSKRSDGEVVSMQRDYLQKYVYWFQTHDNPVDEYWYGLYNEDSFFSYVRDMTQEKYDDSKVARYVMRMLWMFRNTAYGIHYALFSKPSRLNDTFNRVEHGQYKANRFWWYLEVYDKSGFQFKGQLPLLPVIFGINIFNDFNIGWKSHGGTEKCLYANRVVGIRIRKV